jgi:hypothetical protein
VAVHSNEDLAPAHSLVLAAENKCVAHSHLARQQDQSADKVARAVVYTPADTPKEAHQREVHNHCQQVGHKWAVLLPGAEMPGSQLAALRHPREAVQAQFVAQVLQGGQVEYLLQNQLPRFWRLLPRK